MLKRNSDQQRTRGVPAPSHGSRSRSISQFALTLVLVLVLLLVSAAVLATIAHVWQLEEARQSQVRAGAQGLSMLVSERVRYFGLAVGAVVQDRRVIDALRSRNFAELRRLEKGLKPLFPGVLQFRLVPHGQDEPDTVRKPHLSFA